jgi:hypothetical protein
MSVRPTQTKSGYPRRTRQPYSTADQGPDGAELPEPRPDPAPTGAPVGPALGAIAPAPAAQTGSRVADRKAQRAARRTRRNVAIVCGVVVAVCLILTILIVNMARTRTSAPPVVVNPVALSVGPSRAVAVPSPTPNHSTLDAPASEGGNP